MRAVRCPPGRRWPEQAYIVPIQDDYPTVVRAGQTLRNPLPKPAPQGLDQPVDTDRGATVKEHLTGWAVSAGSGLGTAIAGAPWWAVLLAVGVVLGSTYGMVYVLSKNPRVKRISTFLMSVDTTEPEEPPPKSEAA
jgi:hypothetical protein